MEKGNNLNQIDLIIDDQKRTAEIATWMQKYIKDMKKSIHCWEIIEHCKQEKWGIKAIYVYQDTNLLKSMQSSLQKYIPTRKLESKDAGDLSTIDQYCWQQIALQLCCQYNVIAYLQRKEKKVQLYGFEDFEKSLSAIKKYHGGNKYGKKSRNFQINCAKSYLVCQTFQS